MQPRILVIEDEPRWHEQFQDILQGMGFDVDVAKEAQEAKLMLQGQKYALVLLDAALDQPHLTLACQQFCDSLHKRYPHLPIVATSGKPLQPEEMRILFKELGIVDFIPKDGLQLRDFRKRVRVALKKRGAQPAKTIGYNSAIIRKLLAAAFSDDELTTLCFDDFREVYDEFTGRMSKATKIQLLIEHAEQRNQTGALLKRVESANRPKYEEYKDRLLK